MSIKRFSPFIALFAALALSGCGGGENSVVAPISTITSVSFTSQPASAQIGSTALSAIIVQLTDQFGNPLGQANVPITLTVKGTTFLSGTTTVQTDTTGRATFSGLVLANTDATGVTLTASVAGLSGVSSSVFNVARVNAFGTAAPTAPALSGTSSTFTVTVPVLGSNGQPITNAKGLTLTVTNAPDQTFTVNGTAAASGTATLTGVNTDANGNATLTVVVTNPSGPSQTLSVADALDKTATPAAVAAYNDILEFLAASSSTNGAGVTLAPLVSLVSGAVNAATAITQAVTGSAQGFVVTSDAHFAFLSNGTNTIQQFTVNPATGALTPNGSFTSPNAGDAFFDLLVDATNGFLILNNKIGFNSNVEVVNITSNGTLTNLQVLIPSADTGVAANAMALTTVNGTQVFGLVENFKGQALRNSQDFNDANLLVGSVTPSNGNLVLGTLEAGTTLNNNHPQGGAFTTSSGNLFFTAVDAAQLYSLKFTVTNGNVDPLPAAVTASVSGASGDGCMVGDPNGHLFVTNGGTTNNVQAFQLNADGSMTAIGSAGSTVAQSGAGGLVLEPSTFGFLYVANSAAATNNISVFPLTNGQLGTPVAQTLGSSVTQLFTFKGALH